MNVELKIEFDAALDEARLRSAVDAVLARHDVFAAPSSAALVRIDGRGLQLSLDEAVADAGSLRALSRQIAQAYGDRGEASAERGFQPAEFIAWRREIAQSNEAASQRAHWRRHLGEPNASDALCLKVRQRADEGAVAHRRVAAHRRLDARLLAASTEPPSQLQATWWLLLSRLNSFERFVGGWLHDCRDDYGPMRDAVGVFEAVLPIVVAPQPGQTFESWSSGLRQTLQGHVEAQELCEPQGHARRAMFAFDAIDPLHGEAAGWRVSVTPRMPGHAELALHCTRSAGGLDVQLSADALRYDARALECLLDQFSTLLQAAVSNPQASLAALPLIGDAERASLLSLRGPLRDVASGNVGERIVQWAQRTPDAAALQQGEVSIDYRALDERVARVAHWMSEQGVLAGGLVALDMPRSIDLVVAMLAAWRLGAAYLPLEPGWPEARRRALLEDARAAAVFDALPSSRELPAALPARQTDPCALAYVLYTSGSTGQPKGVEVGQAALLNYVAAASEAMGLSACRRWALTSSVAADLGHTALFGALFNGACLVIAHDDDVKDAAAFSRFVAHRHIDALKIVPSHLEALLEHDAPHLPATVVLGGEPASARLIGRMRAIAPSTRLFNHYGPTEATVGVMVHRIATGDAGAEAQPLTEVLANNGVRVLDGDLQLVPVGMTGELYIGGAQLCRGYRHRDAAAVFIDDPFTPGERLYRTGDLAWVRPQGGIVLAGRADHQLKLRGHRVDPAEVEAALLALPGVSQALATGRPSSNPVAGAASGPLELVAVAVGDADAASLRRRLAALLPPHMLPSRCLVVPALPRLPNGKVDRRAVAALFEREGRAGEADLPATDALDEIESAVASHLKALLQRETIGTEDDIFDLGAHSLLVIKLVARLRKQLGIGFAPSLVFDHPTIASLASALRALRQEALS